MIRKIDLTGYLVIEDDDGPSALMKSAKGSALLAYLLVTRQPHTREFLAALLWDGPSTGDTLAALRRLLYRIRPLLPRLAVTHQQIAYPIDEEITIELYALEAALAGDKLDDDNLDQLDQALRLYRGELLAGFYLEEATGFSEWLALERVRLRLRVSDGHRRVCAAYAAQAKWGKGIAVARRWLALDEFDEEVHRQLLRLLAADGQVMAAKEHYAHLCRRLWDELAVEPEPATVELYEQIQATSRAPLAREQSPRKTSDHQHWGEAPTIDTFFGREAEIAQLVEWLHAEAVHLVAILGIGGQDKTSLAAKIARTHAEGFAGVYWRSLINAPPLDMVLHDYLNFVSGNASTPPTDIATTIAEIRRHLRRERHLLVLDNLETILDPQHAGHWRSGYEDYAEVLRLFGQGGHGSTLLFTMNTQPITDGHGFSPAMTSRVISPCWLTLRNSRIAPHPSGWGQIQQPHSSDTTTSPSATNASGKRRSRILLKMCPTCARARSVTMHSPP
ncbi:MAG: bacterial transcriptional activator domain-containing protein [Caldilineaceae bacterium]